MEIQIIAIYKYLTDLFLVFEKIGSIYKKIYCGVGIKLNRII